MAFLNVERSNNHRNRTNDNYNYDYDNVGMYGNTIKSEGKLLSMIITTITEIVVILAVLLLIAFIALNVSKFKFDLFTMLDEYTLVDYNNAIKRSFLILSVAIVVICFIVKLVINNAIRGRFRKKYLKKVFIYIFDVFIVIINACLYLAICFLFFFLVNEINDIIATCNFIEEVNKETINIFKYIAVIVPSIFGVLNSFSGININHNKNKFVLEDFFVE